MESIWFWVGSSCIVCWTCPYAARLVLAAFFLMGPPPVLPLLPLLLLPIRNDIQKWFQRWLCAENEKLCPGTIRWTLPSDPNKSLCSRKRQGKLSAKASFRAKITCVNGLRTSFEALHGNRKVFWGCLEYLENNSKGFLTSPLEEKSYQNCRHSEKPQECIGEW